MKNWSLFALLATAVASSPLLAFTKTVKFCYRSSDAVYVDSERRALSDGTTEDYFSASSSDEALRGLHVTIKQMPAATTVWSGYTGDGLGSGDYGAGCTDTFSITSNASSVDLAHTLLASGVIQTNSLTVTDSSGNIGALGVTAGTCMNSFGCSTSPPPTTLIVASGSALNVAIWQAYAASAFALYRHNGGVSGEFDVVVSPDDGNYYSPSDDKVHLRTADAAEKFTVIHEIGHRMAALAVGDGIPEGYGATEGDCPTSTGQHSMGSKEFSGTALSEALGHFYALDVWNSHGQTSAVFQYYKNEYGNGLPAVDGEAAAGTDRSRPLKPDSTQAFPRAFMETRCTGTTSGRAVELDWMRVLWAMHTNGATPPTFTQILDWIDGAEFYTLYPYMYSWYVALDLHANTVGGQLNTNWDNYKAVHGVDH